MAAPSPGAAPPSPPAAAWREIGRAEPGEALWVTWVAFLGDGGDALYRSLVVADGAIEVSVELQPRSGAGGARTVHRGRCGLPSPDDARGIESRAALLLAAADKTVSRALEVGAPVTGEGAGIRPADRARAPGSEARSVAPRGMPREAGAPAAGPFEARP
jgi:hypothetical protein